MTGRCSSSSPSRIDEMGGTDLICVALCDTPTVCLQSFVPLLRSRFHPNSFKNLCFIIIIIIIIFFFITNEYYYGGTVALLCCRTTLQSHKLSKIMRQTNMHEHSGTYRPTNLYAWCETSTINNGLMQCCMRARAVDTFCEVTSQTVIMHRVKRNGPWTLSQVGANEPLRSLAQILFGQRKRHLTAAPSIIYNAREFSLSRSRFFAYNSRVWT